MEFSDYKRIAIGDSWWFSIQPDKMVFGGNFLPDGVHCTYSFGLKSGFVDLHLSKDLPNCRKVHFPIVRVRAKDILGCFDPIKLRLLDSVFIGLEEISESDFINSIGYIPLHDENQPSDERFITEVLTELLLPKNKRKLNIDHKTPEFESRTQSFAQRYADRYKEKMQNPQKIREMNFCTGILIKKESRRLFVKISIGNVYRLFSFDNLDLDHISILKKFLGKELYELLSSKFNEGLEELKTLTEPKTFEGLTLTLSSSSDTED